MEWRQLGVWGRRPVNLTALIGPAGNGRSHRASLAARAHRVKHGVDDGLLIHPRS